MDIGASRILHVVIHISALACIALSVDFRWRLDNCRNEVDELPCMITIRRWCNCSSLPLDSTCPCRFGNASNLNEVATNITRDISVNSADAMFKSNSTSGVPFSDLCNTTTCEIIPIPCEWSPWKLIIDTCLMKHFVRKRDKCCHPIYHHAINATCNFQKVDHHSVWRSFSECYPSSSMNDHENNNNYSENDHETGETTRYMLFFGMIIILFIFFMVMYGAIRKRKSRGALPVEQATPLRPTRSLRPQVVIYPEPGQPIAESLLPTYLKT